MPDPCIVVFNYATWGLRYPTIAAWVGPDLAQLYFDEATLYLNNTPFSPVADLAQRAVLLNMLTAHIALLNAAIAGNDRLNLVGRITSASQGSVSVALDAGAQPATAAWFMQTSQGFAYWQATAQYRTFRYRAPIQPNLGVTPFGYRGFRGF